MANRTEEEAKVLFAPLQGTDKVSPQGWTGFFCGAAMGPGLILLEALLVLMGLSLVPGAERRLKTPGLEGAFWGAAMGPGLALILLLHLMVLLGPSLVSGTERRLKTPAARFLAQRKPECRHANGTRGEVRYLFRDFYDRQEIARFDSRGGLYQAVSPLCLADERDYNRDPQALEYARASVESYCRHNCEVATASQMVGRKVQPLVKISPTKAEPLSHHTLLICTATGYYPSEIKIKWLKNGQEQTEGVGYAEELQNGDWTFQNQVMLETVPEQGDVYVCQVEHWSREEPITVHWEPQTSDSAKSKVWTGVVGAVLGVVFVAVGLALYLKSGKGNRDPPPPGILGPAGIPVGSALQTGRICT
ncbi:H-2 class II histocompatibility antigen, E-S beta chain-like [Eublepharis macularius]|uniref:H-2 class II histocompatibility antigen, E-S beta chain-like n=1 Tax=Eublepharis macularius TaxID=481883 RepID=A0AA97KW32_EUBMA|nr:H-2 class II histocompatibility antigen, E-S beta chain-like [Eublepharis macularius]